MAARLIVEFRMTVTMRLVIVIVIVATLHRCRGRGRSGGVDVSMGMGHDRRHCRCRGMLGTPAQVTQSPVPAIRIMHVRQAQIHEVREGQQAAAGGDEPGVHNRRLLEIHDDAGEQQRQGGQ